MEEEAQAILARYPERRSALMPLLHACQERRGYLTTEDFEQVAAWIGETPAFVESVASFYALYRRKPHGKVCLTVCTNLSCSLAGASGLVEQLSERLGVQPGETTADGLFHLETTSECLAACDAGPMLQANLEYHLRLTPERVDRLIEDLRRRYAGTGGSGGPAAASGSAARPEGGTARG